jgi:hypothetical protein
MPDQYTTSNFVSRFIGFDRMLGSFIIKVLYYLGLIAILLLTILGVVSIFTDIGAAYVDDPDVHPAIATAGLIVGAILAVIVWRYICEVSILAFQIYNRLGEIRDRLPEPDPNRKLASHV